MLGIRCRVPAGPLVALCQAEHLLVVPAAEETLRYPAAAQCER